MPPQPGEEYFQIYLFTIVREWLNFIIAENDALCENIQGVYLLGDYLVLPFIAIGAYLRELDMSIDAADNRLREFLAYVEWFAFGDGLYLYAIYYFPFLENLFSDPLAYVLDTLFSAYEWIYDFFDDPILFITDLVNILLGDIGDFLNDPLGFVENILNLLIPDFSLFLNDPLNFILTLLGNYSPLFLDFLLDPIGTIIEWIGYDFPNWFDFINDPLSWVISLLTEGYSELIDFFNDPFGYIQNLVNAIIDEIGFNPIDVGLGLADNLLNILFDNLLWFIDKLTDLIIEIIVENL